jgi:hypothetical protein
MEQKEKFYPEIGTKLYLSQHTGNGWVDMCKYPYTVIGQRSGKLLVQECELIFRGDRYYDTVADEIRPDPNGEVIAMNWSKKYGRWQYDKYQTGYPQIAHFGSWEHQPYLD